MISFGKVRPQIFVAITLLGAITGYAIYSDMVEIATGTVGGMVALAMKIMKETRVIQGRP